MKTVIALLCLLFACPVAGQTLSLKVDPRADDDPNVTIRVVADAIPSGEWYGVQCFIEFDATRLHYVGGTLTDDPFGQVVYPLTVAGGSIAFAVGTLVPDQSAWSGGECELAVLHFTATAGKATFVRWQTHNPPTRFTDGDGDPYCPSLVSSAAIVFQEASEDD